LCVCVRVCSFVVSIDRSRKVIFGHNDDS